MAVGRGAGAERGKCEPAGELAIPFPCLDLWKLVEAPTNTVEVLLAELQGGKK